MLTVLCGSLHPILSASHGMRGSPIESSHTSLTISTTLSFSLFPASWAILSASCARSSASCARSSASCARSSAFCARSSASCVIASRAVIFFAKRTLSNMIVPTSDMSNIKDTANMKIRFIFCSCLLRVYWTIS